MHKTLQRLIILGILVIMTLSLTPLDLIYAQDEPAIKATVTSTALVVREGPGVNFNDLALLEEDAEFTVLGRETLPDNGLWIYGQTADAIRGWVLSDFLAFPVDFSVSDAPVVDYQSVPTGLVTSADEDTEADTSTAAEAETDTSTSSGTSTSFTRNVKLLATTVKATEVHEHAGMVYPVIGELKPETQVIVLGRSKGGFWIQITLVNQSDWTNYKVGWVLLWQLELPDDAPELTIIEDIIDDESDKDAPPEDEAEDETEANSETSLPVIGDSATTSFVNLRTGPGLNYGVIQLLDPNTPVTLAGRNEDYTWLVVEVAGQTGWAYRPLINIAEGEVVSLPMVEAPALPSSGIDPSAVHYYPMALNSSPAAQGDNDLDGRLNPYMYLASGLIYCFDGEGYTDRGNYSGGGILVFLFYGDPQGVVFVAQESQIHAVGVPAEPTLIHADSGFYLYRMPDGAFQMNGPNTDGTRFSVQWHDCGPNPVTQ